jgi:protein-S-isoprenylcysteine O-methyltransferase Ste14
MAIVQIAITIFIFTLFFIIFTFSKTNQKVGVWIIVMILLTLVIGMTTMGASSQFQRTHPAFLIGKYSKYNSKNPIY